MAKWAHGKCLKGNHLLVWRPPPRVSDAYCPQHDFPLSLSSRQPGLPVSPESMRPQLGPRHTTNARMLGDKG